MKKRVLAGAALALALSAGQASATTYCFTGVSGFSACASATIVVNGGLTQLQISIQNLSGVLGNTTFSITSFGLYYLVPPNYTGSLTGLSPFAGWTNGPNNALQNPGPSGTALWVGGAQTTNGANASLVGCGVSTTNRTDTCSSPATFTFTLSAGANFSLANLNVAIRGQEFDALNGAFTGQSFKCYSTDPSCQPPTNVVPEPATMMLLGTGLVALSFAGIRRRRNRTPQA